MTLANFTPEYLDFLKRDGESLLSQGNPRAFAYALIFSSSLHRQNRADPAALIRALSDLKDMLVLFSIEAEKVSPDSEAWIEIIRMAQGVAMSLYTFLTGYERKNGLSALLEDENAPQEKAVKAEAPAAGPVTEASPDKAASSLDDIFTAVVNEAFSARLDPGPVYDLVSSLLS